MKGFYKKLENNSWIYSPSDKIVGPNGFVITDKTAAAMKDDATNQGFEWYETSPKEYIEWQKSLNKTSINCLKAEVRKMDDEETIYELSAKSIDDNLVDNMTVRYSLVSNNKLIDNADIVISDNEYKNLDTISGINVNEEIFRLIMKKLNLKYPKK